VIALFVLGIGDVREKSFILILIINIR